MKFKACNFTAACLWGKLVCLLKSGHVGAHQAAGHISFDSNGNRWRRVK